MEASSAGESSPVARHLLDASVGRRGGKDGGDRGDAGSEGRGARPAEQLVWRGSYSAKGMINAWLLAALVTIVALALLLFGPTEPPVGWYMFLGSLALWAWLGLVYAYRRLSVRYELTTHRFLHYHGLLHRYAERIEVIDMDDITFDQSLIERMFDVGRITITGSDRTHPRMVLRGVDHVARVSGLLDDVRHQERRRRGLYVESL